MKTNRLESLFGRKNRDILSIYFTCGFPKSDSMEETIRELARGGVDMVEIGVPFSDPMADGPVIQHSSTIALRNGMNLRLLLEQTKKAREISEEMPFVLMGYLNPFMQYGFRKLFEDCREAGIDAMIVPDLPFEDYLSDFKPLCKEFGIPMIMLITPETSEERVRLIDENCDGFIYMVSSASTTGTKDRFSDEQLDYFKRIDGLELKHPRLIGFGISNPDTLREAWCYSSGAIIGSLFIKCLERNTTVREAVEDLTETLGVGKHS